MIKKELNNIDGINEAINDINCEIIDLNNYETILKKSIEYIEKNYKLKNVKSLLYTSIVLSGVALIVPSTFLKCALLGYSITNLVKAVRNKISNLKTQMKFADKRSMEQTLLEIDERKNVISSVRHELVERKEKLKISANEN